MNSTNKIKNRKLKNDLPIIFRKFWNLITPRVPEFGKSMYKDHQRFPRVSSFDVVQTNTLHDKRKIRTLNISKWPSTILIKWTIHYVHWRLQICVCHILDPIKPLVQWFVVSIAILATKRWSQWKKILQMKFYWTDWPSW